LGGKNALSLWLAGRDGKVARRDGVVQRKEGPAQTLAHAAVAERLVRMGVSQSCLNGIPSRISLKERGIWASHLGGRIASKFVLDLLAEAAALGDGLVVRHFVI
jgi:hypothetical protein